MNLNEIRDAVAARRKELDLTQEALAKQSGGSRESYLRFEGGKTGHDIGLRRLIRILSTLGLEIALRPMSAPPTLEELNETFRDEQ
ncbi:MAG: hypothetical protein BroJett021_34790 [Chloroflexota bacterium]|nr:MAG: hypothetical protein BroJett021_34790 [Chloroflexota bacterium]